MRRFSDTKRMEETWYCEMSLAQRCVFEFIWAKADCAGVWSVNKKFAEMCLGEKLDWPAFVAACGSRLVELDTEHWWLADLIPVNCGKLSRECKAHLPIFASIEKHRLRRHLDSYSIAIGTLQEKETDKEPTSGKGVLGENQTPTLAEVLGYASSPQGNIPADVAEIWWNEHEARPRHSSGGYTDKSELLVLDWKAALRGYSLRWRNNETKAMKPKTNDPKIYRLNRNDIPGKWEGPDLNKLVQQRLEEGRQ